MNKNTARAKPGREPKAPHEVAVPSDMIRTRAFEIFEERNGEPGDAMSDWILAENELRGPAQDAKAGSPHDILLRSGGCSLDSVARSSAALAVLLQGWSPQTHAAVPRRREHARFMRQIERSMGADRRRGRARRPLRRLEGSEVADQQNQRHLVTGGLAPRDPLFLCDRSRWTPTDRDAQTARQQPREPA